MTDKIKLGGAAVLLGIGIWGYYWLADSALVLRILSVVAGALAGAAVAWFSAPGREFALFAGESVTETLASVLRNEVDFAALPGDPA